MAINPAWNLWIEENKTNLNHLANYEERFVREVLTRIRGLEPKYVISQYPFKDQHGRDRRIDFVIKDERFGIFLAIELDGRSKLEGEYKNFEDFLDRQNAISQLNIPLLRYANLKWINEGEFVATEIQTFIKKQVEENRERLRNKRLLLDGKLSVEQNRRLFVVPIFRHHLVIGLLSKGIFKNDNPLGNDHLDLYNWGFPVNDNPLEREVVKNHSISKDTPTVTSKTNDFPKEIKPAQRNIEIKSRPVYDASLRITTKPNSTKPNSISVSQENTLKRSNECHSPQIEKKDKDLQQQDDDGCLASIVKFLVVIGFIGLMFAFALEDALWLFFLIIAAIVVFTIKHYNDK